MMLRTIAILVGLFATTCLAQTRPTTQPAASGFAPISYFNDRCGTCHGDYANYMGRQFGARHAAEGKLRQIVHEMVVGPAQSELTDAETEILTAYHRSILDGRPFVVVTKIEGNTISGEATPESRLELRIGDQRREIPVEEHRWSIEVQGDVQDAVLVARLGEVETTVAIGAEAYSHPKE
jgi:hypothetical protein